MFIDEMRKLKGKRAEMVIHNYRNNINSMFYSSVTSFYKSCSYLKKHAERYILNEMSVNNGYGYCILGGNSMIFSCAYRCGDWLVYHTHVNVWKIKYPA